MYRLGDRTSGTESKLGRSYTMVEVYRKSFLKERSIYVVHSISEGDRSIVGKERSILLVILDEHDNFRVEPRSRGLAFTEAVIIVVKKIKAKDLRSVL